MNRFFVSPFLTLGFLIAAAAPALAQEFRIDTEMFLGDKKEPFAETLTLFSSGIVYDFLLTRPEEITMFDPLRGRFALLDPVRQIRCGISTQEVLDYSLALESHAAESKDPLFMFAASPMFTTTAEEFEQNGQKLLRLVLAGKPLEYSVVARKPDRPEAVPAIRNFTDWFARLNAMGPGSLPAAARLEVNKAVAERDLVPYEVTRTIGKSVVRSRHLVTWTLSGEDRKRIERAGTLLAELKDVKFEEYRAATATGSKSQQAKR